MKGFDMRPVSCATALAAVLALGPVGAGAATFTSFWAFGDSLSDPGNLFDLTSEVLPPGEALPPSPPYARRASNGPVWAEHVAEGFDRRGLPTGNFAYAFARALPNDDIADGLPVQVPDLPDQIGRFDAEAAGRLGERPVAALWFGANDLFAAIRSGDPVTVIATATAAAAAVLDGIGDLATRGIEDFLVFNLPPLELVPAFALARPEAAPLAQIGAQTFNATLAAGLDVLGEGGLAVSTIDIDAALRAVIADPGSIGLSDATFPCYVSPEPPETRCSDAELARKVFFDLVHPTAAVHAAIAGLARAEVAPVPLPPALASLGAAVLALGALRLRRPSAA